MTIKSNKACIGKPSHGNNYLPLRLRSLCSAPPLDNPPPCPTPTATSPTNFSSSLVLVMLPRRSAKSVKVPQVNRRSEESQSEYVLCHNAWNGDRVQLPHPQSLLPPDTSFGFFCWGYNSADTGGEGPESEDGQDSNPYPLEGKYVDDADRQKCVFLLSHTRHHD